MSNILNVKKENLFNEEGTLITKFKSSLKYDENDKFNRINLNKDKEI